MSDDLKRNLDELEGHLARFAGSTLPHFVAGNADPGVSGETFSNTTPIDNSVINTVAAGNAADVDRAVRAAGDAFPHWRQLPGSERQALLHAVADGIEARAQEIALLESYDTGQPIAFMSKAAIRGAENFRFYADKAPEATNGLSMPAQAHLNYSIRQPIGPVAVITPWNTPFMLSTWKIAPALAAGCTVVHKTAERSPLTASLPAEICRDAGVPAGVLNTVNGTGEGAGRALTEHPGIKAIAFVGDSQTGRQSMRQGAMTLKRVHFELGGKNPVIVFADADLDRALEVGTFMSYSLNGERCTASSRLLVESAIYEEFTQRVAARAQSLSIGHPLDPNTEVGPLIHTDHLAKVLGYFEQASLEGADIAVGGERSGDSGNFVKPTLFTNADNAMRISQEEIFGPVLTALRFSDEADAIRQANDVPYGLAAYVWTGDSGRSHRIAHALDAGMIWLNSENNRHLPTPFGGMKASGIGRDGGDYSFDFYMETKNGCVALGTHAVPSLGR